MIKSPGKLKLSEVKPLYCLTGEDVYLKLRLLSELKEAILSADGSPLNYEYFLGDETSAATILDAARTAAWGLFSLSTGKAELINRLVVVDQAENLPLSDWKIMKEYFSDPEPGTCLVFLVNRKVKGGVPSKYFPKKYLREFSSLKAKSLLIWARAESRRKNISIPDDVLQDIITATGERPGSIAGELEKLSLYKGPGGEVTSDEVREMVGTGRREKIFDLAGLIVVKKTGVALELLHKLLDEGNAPLKILALMIRAFRQMWLGIDARENNGNQHAVCQAAGIWYNKTDFMNQIERLSPGDIPDIYRRLVEADEALKGGEKLHSLVLERLVIELAAIGR
jgi:DNA polymerase III subunit delta